MQYMFQELSEQLAANIDALFLGYLDRLITINDLVSNSDVLAF